MYPGRWRKDLYDEPGQEISSVGTADEKYASDLTVVAQHQTRDRWASHGGLWGIVMQGDPKAFGPSL